MIINETLKTKVTYNCDVLVAGGGIAGISAALAAARNNKKVLLIEKSYILGGLATAGLVTIYLPLCDGTGRQVSFGIANELLKLSVSEHPIHTRGYDEWILNKRKHTSKSRRFEVDYNPSMFAIQAEKLLLKEGVKILYGSYAVNAEVKNKRITHVVIEGKSGRQAIKAKNYIDATGDFDIGHFAKCPEEKFKQGNILAAWYYFANKGTTNKLKILGFCDIPDSEKTKDNKVNYLNNNRYSGIDTEENSKFVQLAHEQNYIDILKNKKKDSSYEPTLISTIPQFRMTRRIKGVSEIRCEDEHKYCEDSIGLVSNWKKRGPVYEVPFSTLYSKKIVNLYAAGRCTSATEDMWDVMRVIPCCAVTGEAAGTAAALSDDVTKINVKKLQEQLIKQGVVLHENDLKEKEYGTSKKCK